MTLMAVVKRSRDAERSREKILDAAEKLFAERGYEATSLQLVGTAAGVSRATPGYFFGSKEGLYRAVFNRAFTRVDAIIHEAYAEAGDVEPREAIATIVSAYLSIPHQFVRLSDREALSGGKTIQDIEPRLSQLRSSLDRLDALTGKQLKEVPPHPPADLHRRARLVPRLSRCDDAPSAQSRHRRPGVPCGVHDVRHRPAPARAGAKLGRHRRFAFEERHRPLVGVRDPE